MSSRHSHEPIGPVDEDRRAIAKVREEQAAIPMGIIASGVGVFLALIGFGVVPVAAGSVHAPMWIISASGAAFFCSGIAIVFNSRALSAFRFIGHIFGFLALVSMLSILSYFVYMRPGTPAIIQWGVGLLFGFIILMVILSYIPGSGVTRVQDGRSMSQRLEDRRRR